MITSAYAAKLREKRKRKLKTKRKISDCKLKMHCILGEHALKIKK